MATLGESLPPEVLEYLAKLKGDLPADPNAQAAQSAVDAQSIPGSTAADSAQTFLDAGSVPTKSAASSADAIEAALSKAGIPAEAASGAVPTAAADAVPAAAVGAAESAAPAMGDVLTDALGGVSKVAGEAALPLTVAQAALSGPESATSSPMDGPVPGQPGKVFQGQDIVDDPSTTGSADDVVKDTGDLKAVADRLPDSSTPSSQGTTPIASDADGKDGDDDSSDATTAPQAAVAKAVDKVTDSKSKLDPVLQQYLQDKQDLLDAQAKANKNQEMASFGRAGATLAHAIAGARGPVDEKPWDAFDAEAQQPVTDVKNRQEQALKGLQTQQAMYQTKALADEQDPNSDVSKRTQAAYGPLMKMAGLDPTAIQGLSAGDIKATMDKPIEFSAKLQELKDVAQMRRMQMQDSRDLKQQHQDEQEGAVIAGKLNAMTASSRSTLGLASKAKVQASRLKEILSDPNATTQDLNSAYADLNGIVSGTTTMGGTAHQAYSNLQTKIADGLSFLTSNPTAPNIPEIKKHVADMADKMTSISDQVINNNTKSIQAGHAGWVSRHPDLWQNQLDVQNASMGLGSAPPQASVGTSAGPTPPGTVAIRDPKGNIRHIPTSMQAAALANGGTLVQ